MNSASQNKVPSISWQSVQDGHAVAAARASAIDNVGVVWIEKTTGFCSSQLKAKIANCVRVGDDQDAKVTFSWPLTSRSQESNFSRRCADPERRSISNSAEGLYTSSRVRSKDSRPWPPHSATSASAPPDEPTAPWSRVRGKSCNT